MNFESYNNKFHFKNCYNFLKISYYVCSVDIIEYDGDYKKKINGWRLTSNYTVSI